MVVINPKGDKASITINAIQVLQIIDTVDPLFVAFHSWLCIVQASTINYKHFNMALIDSEN